MCRISNVYRLQDPQYYICKTSFFNLLQNIIDCASHLIFALCSRQSIVNCLAEEILKHLPIIFHLSNIPKENTYNENLQVQK